MDPSHAQFSTFMEHYRWENLVKSRACFKGDGSWIDLIPFDRKYIFKNTSSFKTDISDHHHLIYLMLKTTFDKEESKKITCQSYEQLRWENFEKYLKSSLTNCDGSMKIMNKI